MEFINLESSRLAMKRLGSRKRKMRRRAVSMEHRKEEMRRKLGKLQRLIPGGQELRQANSLFTRVADYIMLLRFKIALVQTLTSQLDSKDQP